MKIEEIVKEFKKNEILFPSSWSDTRNISEDISYRTYFNDNRSYFVVQINLNTVKIECTVNDYEISILHPLNKSISEKRLIDILQQILNYHQSKPEEVEQERLDRINSLKMQLKNLKIELNKLQVNK